MDKKAEEGNITTTKAPPPKAPDGGWSWVVIACAFFNSIVIFSISLTFGVVFSDKLTTMGLSSTTVTWIYNLFNFNFYLMSVLCGPLSDVFSWRRVGFVSATVTGVAYACMVFVNGPGLVFLLFSVVVGYSTGLVGFIGFFTIPHYFDLRRGRAGAIMMTGTSLGQMIMPLLFRHLLDEYGFSGACLIFAGLVFNSAALSLLFYSVPKRPRISGDLMHEAERHKRDSPVPIKKKDNSTLKKKSPGSSQSFYEKFKETFNITWRHTCQLKHWTLFVVTMSFASLVVGYGNFTALLPFAIAAKGHPASTTSYSLSIGALVNTLARICVSFVSDAKWFNRKISYIFGSIIAGVSTLATVFVLHDSVGIMVCQIFWGLGIGMNISVFHNLIIDTCGRELYDAGVVINSLQLAVCNIIFGPLIGVARDYTSYEVGIGMTAGFQMLCAVLWIFMPLARRHDREKFQDSQLTGDKSGKAINCDAHAGVFKRKWVVGEVNNGFVVDSDVADRNARRSV